jgi:muramidase (phage lysozyme)
LAGEEMSEITAAQAGSQNRCAFLDMLAWSEGTSTDPVTQDRGYDVLVTGINGPARFASYATFPDILVVVNSAGLESTAAGRYQLLNHNYQYYSAFLKLYDFGPLTQDLIALQQIRERGALPVIDAGNFAQAVQLCNNIWASLPGSPYGQPVHTIDVVQAQYVAAGGTLC